MFNVEASVHSLGASASPLPNNLSLLCHPAGTHRYAYIHKTSVFLTIIEEGDKQRQVLLCSDPSGSVLHFTQVKWCTLRGQDVLVVCGTSGIQLFDTDGSKLYSFSSFSKGPQYLRGIASSDDRIYVGSSSGSVLVFTLTDKSFKDGNGLPASTSLLTLSKEVPLHKDPIMALAAIDKRLGSCDENGGVSLWEGDALNLVYSSAGPGMPVNCLMFHGQYLICGGANGEITIINAQKREKMAVIQAHARPITALDVDPASEIFGSVSEDGFFHVWSTPGGGRKDILTLKFSAKMEDRMLYGLCLSPETGHAALVSYDSPKLLTFLRS